MLKRETVTKFPKWAPRKLIARYERAQREATEGLRGFDEYTRNYANDIKREIDKANEPLKATHAKALATFQEKRARERSIVELRHKGAVDLQLRLLTDQRMKNVWSKLTNAANYGAGEGIPHTDLYMACAICAWRAPRGEELWTPGKRAQWLKDIAHLTQILASKFEGTSANAAIWNIEDRGTVSDMLRSLGRSAGRYLEPVRNARPGDSHARRVRFIRIMGEWCRCGLGAARVDLITPTAIVALADEKLTDRQVYRALATIASSSRNSKKSR